jgi:hypothetical protein
MIKNTTNEKKYLPLANFSFASFTTSNDLITISGKVKIQRTEQSV